MRRLHLARSCASSLDNYLTDKSSLMLSNHLLFGLPLFVSPGTSITVTPVPTRILLLFSIHAHTTSTYFPALYLDIYPTFVVPLMVMFCFLPLLLLFPPPLFSLEMQTQRLLQSLSFSKSIRCTTMHPGVAYFTSLGKNTRGQDYKRFSSMDWCSTHNLCSEMT